MALSYETALKVAYAYKEIEVAETLLAEIRQALNKREAPDVRDAFGRRAGALQLGVPSGNNGQRLFNVPWELALPVIEAHIAQQKSIISALSEKARIEVEPNKDPSIT